MPGKLRFLVTGICLAVLVLAGWLASPAGAAALSIDQSTRQSARGVFPMSDPESVALPPETVVPEGCEVTTNVAYEMSLFELINAEREARGLQPLAWNDTLAAAARNHSIDMACRDYFSHITPDGVSFDQRVSAAGYDFYAVAENLYAGDEQFNSPERAFRGWYYSTDHFVVMINPVYTEVGIGYVYSPGSRYGGYFTAEFATPE